MGAEDRISRIRRLTRQLALGLALALGAALAAAPALARTPAPLPRHSAAQFMASTGYSGLAFAPDGRQLYLSSNRSGRWQLEALPLAGGPARALPAPGADDDRFLVAAFPRDGRLLYSADQGGNERTHLFVREPDGRVQDLTPGDGLTARFHGWLADGSGFLVSTNERDARAFDLYRIDAAKYHRTLLWRNETGLDIALTSRDGRWVALGPGRTTADADIHLLDLDDGSQRLLTPHSGVSNFSALAFDPAGARLVLSTDQDSEYAQLRTLALAGGALATPPASEAGRDGDVQAAAFSPDGRYRLVLRQREGRSELQLFDRRRQRVLHLPPLPAGQLRQPVFSPDSRRLAFLLNDDRSPSNVFVLDLATGAWRQLTHSLAPPLTPRQLAAGRALRFASFDGLMIPAIFYRPAQASSRSPAPAVVLVHGGPGGQSTRGYHALTQFLVHRGYAVLAVNHRGSSGYGKAFLAADDHRHGREPLWDCVAARHWLAAQPGIDGQRVAILGGSYGGYMVLAALAFRPEAFGAGVDLFGVSNWLRTLESIPPHWTAYRRALATEIGDPETEAEMLRAISPLFHADQIRSPLLVMQGANDPRVLRAESDEIVDAVRRHGVPVDYLVFDDEGHGFTRRANEVRAYQAIADFLDRHLRTGSR